MKLKNRALKFLVVIISLILFSACTSYRNKFAGYKDDSHLKVSESKGLMMSGNYNVKPYDNTYDIPTVYNTTSIDPKELIIPPGFK